MAARESVVAQTITMMANLHAAAHLESRCHCVASELDSAIKTICGERSRHVHPVVSQVAGRSDPLPRWYCLLHPATQARKTSVPRTPRIASHA
jgi:hypothetical protein